MFSVRISVPHALVLFAGKVPCCNTISSVHPWLADLAAPIGSQEVVDHTHKWWQLIGQHLPGCRLGPLVNVSGDPTCTDLITQPELRQTLTNQHWGLVGVSVTSGDPTGAAKPVNQGWNLNVAFYSWAVVTPVTHDTCLSTVKPRVATVVTGGGGGSAFKKKLVMANFKPLSAAI